MKNNVKDRKSRRLVGIFQVATFEMLASHYRPLHVSRRKTIDSEWISCKHGSWRIGQPYRMDLAILTVIFSYLNLCPILDTLKLSFFDEL